jgi:hypothetical protein
MRWQVNEAHSSIQRSTFTGTNERWEATVRGNHRASQWNGKEKNQTNAIGERNPNYNIGSNFRRGTI